MSRRKHNDLFKLKIVKEYEEWSITCYKLAQKYGVRVG